MTAPNRHALRRPQLTRRGLLRAGAGVAGAAALLPLASCAGGARSESGARVLRLAETHPEDYPTTRADIRFADLVRERSSGRIDVQVFFGGQLGGEVDVIEQVQLGAVEMTRISSAPMSEFASAAGLFSLPYVFDDSDHLWRFLDDGAGRALLDELEPAGFHGLCYFDPGARSFYSAGDPILTPDDVAGRKFRVQESEIILDLVRALGGSPTPMTYGEVYSSIQTGLLDGAENNAPSYFSSSHYEVAGNFVLDEHLRVAEMLIVNLDVWRSFSDADQQLIQQAADDAVPFQREEWDAQVATDLEALADAGVSITPVDDLTPWREAAQPVLDRHGARFADYLARIDELREA